MTRMRRKEPAPILVPRQASSEYLFFSSMVNEAARGPQNKKPRYRINSEVSVADLVPER